MKQVLSVMAAVAFFVPSVGHACPYGAATCDSGGPLLGYGTSLVLGLGIGALSVAFRRGRG